MMTENSPRDVVKLSEITAPVFGEDFATMNDLPVCWGIGNGLVMIESSGYPGFGYPLIVTGWDSHFPQELKLVCSWGKWEYFFVESGEGYINDNLEVCNYNHTISNTKIKGDKLYIIGNKEYAEYELTRGTFVDGEE